MNGSGDSINVLNVEAKDVVNEPAISNNGTRLSVVAEDHAKCKYPNNSPSDAQLQSILVSKIEETQKHVQQSKGYRFWCLYFINLAILLVSLAPQTVYQHYLEFFRSQLASGIATIVRA